MRSAARRGAPAFRWRAALATSDVGPRRPRSKTSPTQSSSRSSLESLPLRRLSFQEECLRKLTLTTDLERSDQRGAGGDSVEDRSTESSASAAERHARQLFLQALPLGGVRRFGESTHEREEPFLLGLFGLQAGLDQVDEHTIGARFPCFGQRADTPGDTSRDRDALTDRPLCVSHRPSLHHDAPVCTSAHLRYQMSGVVDPTSDATQGAIASPRHLSDFRVPIVRYEMAEREAGCR